MNQASAQTPLLSLTAFSDGGFVLLNGNDSTLEQPAHTQSHYEIQYIVSGQGTLSSDKKRLYLSEGDYVLLAPGDLHALKAKDSIRFYSVEFSVGDRAEHHPLSEELHKVLAARREESFFSRRNAAMKPVFENLFREWRERRFAYADCIGMLFLQILVLCCRDAPGDGKDGQDSADILADFFSFIGAHMDDPDVLTSFEKTYGYKRAALTRQAKQRYGKTVFQLYTEKRFEYAAGLLAEGKVSVTEIAGRCAFSSVAAFSKAFANYFRMSPSRYVRFSPKPPEEQIRDIYVDFSTCSAFLTVPAGENTADPESAQPAQTYSNPKLQLL